VARVKQRNLLRRGVRAELFLAPGLVLLPILVGAIFVEQGIRLDNVRYQVLGLVIIAGNLVFDVMMVVTALRFLRISADEDAPGSGG